jgi:hypothetical protein
MPTATAKLRTRAVEATAYHEAGHTWKERVHDDS